MNSCPPCPNMIGSQIGFPERQTEKEILGTTSYGRGGKNAESGEGEKEVGLQCCLKKALANPQGSTEAGAPFRIGLT